MPNFEKIKKFFSFKKKKSNIILNKKPKKGFEKKRKHFKISFEFLKHLKFLKRNYIPYFLICAFIFVAIIIILII
jgi:hypothetical protein